MFKTIDNLFSDLLSGTKSLIEVKKIIVNCGLIKEFVEYCNNRQRFNGLDDLLAYDMCYKLLKMNGPNYTLDNFYEGLPEENRLGVSI